MLFNILEADKRSSGIYIIKNSINDKVYIGSAVDLRSRFYSHRATLKKKIHDNARLQNFANKYGLETLTFDLVELCDRSVILEFEQKWINHYESFKSSKGFNITPTAGSNLGYVTSEETKKKISLAQKGVPKLHRAPATIIKKVCTCCKKEYSFRLSRQKLDRTKFCSKICQGKAKQNKKIAACSLCGKEVERAANKKGVYCSNSCHATARQLLGGNKIGGWNKGNKTQEERACILCQTTFMVKPSIPKKYCSRQCAGKVSGKLAKGGITHLLPT